MQWGAQLVRGVSHKLALGHFRRLGLLLQLLQALGLTPELLSLREAQGTASNFKAGR